MLNYSSADYITDAMESEFRIKKIDINTVPYNDKIADGQIYLGLKIYAHFHVIYVTGLLIIDHFQVLRTS